MNKIQQTYKYPNTRLSQARKIKIENLENSSLVSNRKKESSFFFIEKKNKIIYDDTEYDNSTKKRSLSTKPSSKSSIDILSEGQRSISTKKVQKTEKIQNKEYIMTTFQKRKFSELKQRVNPQRKKFLLPNRKKIFRETLSFKDNKRKTHTFDLFQDNDILNINFKAILINQELDNDVETDEEQLKDAERFMINSIKDGIKEFRKCK